MMPQRLLFWIVVGIIIGTLLLLMANQIIVNMLEVEVTVKPP